MATYGIKLDVIKVFENMTKAEASEMLEKMKPGAQATGYNVTMFISMNTREREIDRLIQEAVSEWIGGLENTLMDFPEDSEDYKQAKKLLNHDSLFDIIYRDIMEESRSNKASHIRFAGKEFIADRIEKALKKDGYGK
jgi:hypothetical protein